MSSKLGLHVQSWAPGTLDSVLRAKGGILKVMAPDVDPVRQVLEQRPATVLVCRKYFSDDEQRQYLSNGPSGGTEVAYLVTQQFAAVIAVARDVGAPVYVEGLNEIGLWNDADQYNEFTRYFAQRCGSLGVRPAVYSFATGNPPGYKDGSPDDLRAYWSHYLLGLYAAKAAGGALALHEYDAGTMRRLAGWLCLRYRRVYDILPADLQDLPLLITECGIDGGVIGAGSADAAGWTNYATADEYGEQLKWYAGELAKDPQVLGATVFTAGGDGMWKSFEVTGVGPVLDAIAASKEEPMQPTYKHADIAFDPIPDVAENSQFTVSGTVTVDGRPETAGALITGSVDLGLRPDGVTSRGNALLGKGTTDQSGRFGITFTMPAGVLAADETAYPGVMVQADAGQFETGDASKPVIDWGEAKTTFTVVRKAASAAQPGPAQPGNGIDLQAARIQLDAQWGNAQIARKKGLAGLADAIEASVIALKDALRL